jgi:hypothetical protein
VASNQRFRLFVKVRGLLLQQQQKVLYSSDLWHLVGCQLEQQQQKVLCSSGVKPKVLSLCQGPRLTFTMTVKGPLFKWRQTKGCVSSSRYLLAFGGLS